LAFKKGGTNEKRGEWESLQGKKGITKGKRKSFIGKGRGNRQGVGETSLGQSENSQGVGETSLGQSENPQRMGKTCFLDKVKTHKKQEDFVEKM